MRSIDFWAGIPLCFLFTILNYILRIFLPDTKVKAVPKKILFIKLSEMGSIILGYPLVNKACKEYPEVEVFFLTFKINEPIFEILNIAPASNVFSIREDSICLFIMDTLRVIKQIRREKIGLVFDLEFFSRFTAILTYLSGAPKRVGFYRYCIEGVYRGNFLTNKVQYNPLLHISKTYLSFWQAAKEDKKSAPELKENIKDEEIFLPEFILPEETKRRIWDKLKRFGVNEGARLLLINPGEGNIPLREWPLENFIVLARKLLEDLNYHLIIIGTEEASKKAQLICSAVNHKRCLDFTGNTTLPEVLCLFNLAEALITNDCGLAHLASLTAIKKFILFGPESPQTYSPLGENTRIIYSGLTCSPCLSAFNHRNSACKENVCLKMIKPEEVYNLISAHLKWLPK